jgi:hypothetical protein
MSQKPLTIPKAPALKPVEDFYQLRRDGIGYIEQMGSAHWTDYNLHDPGITLLEALAYALTDLGYRTGWHIKDLLAPATYGTDTQQPFFTAREILTVNPWTTDDFRRLLIDLPGVRNAWLFCKDCACDLVVYAWCDDKKQIQLAYQKPDDVPEDRVAKIQPRGLYEALLELENDPELGDLNDRKITRKLSRAIGDKLEQYEIELRFPEFDLLDQAAFDAFVTSTDDPLVFDLTKYKLSRSKTDPNEVATDELRQHWNSVFYTSFRFSANGQTIDIPNVSVRFFSSVALKNAITRDNVRALLNDDSPVGFVQLYRRKLGSTQAQIAAAKDALHSHRNLDEDYCRIKRVAVEDVSTCADVEVKSDADIEKVQAQIWFEIEQYFNPPVHFYTLPELMGKGEPVEDIFNGPALDSGFIQQSELEAAGLKTVLRTSDIINRLMDIEGVVAVNNLLLTKYDQEGQIVRGAADIGLETYSPNKISAEWTLAVSANHQPRLYLNMSRFLFYKNGLPFLPRMDEARDTLVQLRGEAERPKFKDAKNDLEVPKGQFRNLEDYYPVQYSLPRAYGVGTVGLPGNSSALRRAQAKQLKGYLMPFEQLLVNSFAQTANVGKLFALDNTIYQTYFARLIDNNLIDGANDIFNGLTQPMLEGLVETEDEFLERRNRFLDHIMARFGENFGEYALLLNKLDGKKFAQQELIGDKIGFLKAYPVISRDRARAFDYTDQPCAPESLQPGLKRRINLLLGYPDLSINWTVVGPAFGQYNVNYLLTDANGGLWFGGNLVITSSNTAEVTTLASDLILDQMTNPSAYIISLVSGAYVLELLDNAANIIGTAGNTFATEALAEAMRDELAAWAGQRRAIIVEHLLLRPKFPGDALFPVCTEGECNTCDPDPYSFRLTFVMPGWNSPYKDNLELRAFADRTVKQETPSHLLPKVCWVGNDGFVADRCDPFIVLLGDFLLANAVTQAGVRPTFEEACTCANSIYNAYALLFATWFEGKELQHFTPVATTFLLDPVLTAIDWTNMNCAVDFSDAALQQALNDMAVKYFTNIVLNGFQFEKFESAWCAWLDANARFDWTETRLEERVTAILANDAAANGLKLEHDALCHCTAHILGEYGTAFNEWMRGHIEQGKDWTQFGTIPQPLPGCPNLNISPTAKDQIARLLKGTTTEPGFYAQWVEVAYRLWLVLDLLAKLRNTYPKATLHDCDDGSDANPVRLNHTALGIG